MANTYHKHITSNHSWFDFRLQEVWQYRDLISLFTKRTFVVTYKQTVLGPAWLFLNPVISSIVYTVVFSGIIGVETDGIPQILFYLCSNGIWHYFSSCVTRNANVFTANAGVFGKVYFPRLTVPISNVCVSVIQLGIQMILILAFTAYFMVVGKVQPIWWAMPFALAAVIELGIMGMGLGIVVSSMTTKYRDLTALVSLGMQLWMYGTPIVYPLSRMQDGTLRRIILLNPVTSPIEVFRYALLGKGTIHIGYLIGSACFTVLVLLGSIMIFNRVEKTFMDTV